MAVGAEQVVALGIARRHGMSWLPGLSSASRLSSGSRRVLTKASPGSGEQSPQYGPGVRGTQALGGFPGYKGEQVAHLAAVDVGDRDGVAGRDLDRLAVPGRDLESQASDAAKWRATAA